MGENTLFIHGNRKDDLQTGATNVPVYLANAYAHKTAKELENIFAGRDLGYIYTRISNPTVEAFEKRMAVVESGISATATASGMSAIYLAVMNVVTPGDEIISSLGLFGGTYNFFKRLSDFGIQVKFLEDLNEETLSEAITEKTKLVFAETIGNPKLNVLDIEEVSKICKEKEVLLMVDSTVTSPHLIKPIEYGADIVIHSTSKYINGTSNSIGGMIVDGGSKKYESDRFPNFKNYTKRFRHFAFTAKLKNEIGKDLGAILSPIASFFNLTGIETLGLRMKVHSDNALQIAKYLQTHEQVESVNYPGLENHKDYALKQKYYEKGTSGILTFRLGSKERAFALIDQLKLISNLANIGDTKSLIIHPASTICIENSVEEKEKMGVYEDMVRLSVGIEDAEDIIEDIEQALQAL